MTSRGLSRSLLIGWTLVGVAAVGAQAPEWDGPFVETVTPEVSPALRDLPLAGLSEGETRPADERQPPPGMVPQPGWDDAATAVDPLAATGVNASVLTPAPLLSFQGQSNTCSCSPPDPIGAVGPNHYLQMVNATKLQIYDKVTGATLAGPIEFRSLWSSGNCSVSSNGDPVVVYDYLANRWVLAQFSTGNGVCVAVSQTNDPTGSYYLYEFPVPQFPDYFKIGAWSNAYYMGSNESSYSAYALDRAAMLAGAAATTIRFTGQSNFLMPATVVGTTPPPGGTPGIFYTFKDDSFHGGADRLDFYHFTPDFTTPGNSTFALAQSVNVTSYTYTVCGFFVLSCIPQGGTAQAVDPVSEWPMWQLQYRNLPGGEKLVANFTVDVGSDRAGIRWYEIAKSGATYTIAQESTYAPGDGRHRWMGSIAMDKDGDIALAYSTSSGSESPSLRYATRLVGDPVGTLQAETTLVAGGGSQTGSNRWGDYSALTVDPVDDCTFWFTGEYFAASSSNGWTTRIGKFVLPECAPSTDLSITKDDGVSFGVPGAQLTYTLTVTNHGPSASTGGMATDVLPAGLTFVSSSDCSEAGGTVTCAIGALAANASQVVSFVVMIDPARTADIVNTASIAANETDPNAGNDSGSHTTPLVPTANVGIAKSDGAATAIPGTATVYTIGASNAGPSNAPAAQVTDTFPAACTSVTWTCSGAGGGSCPANGSGNLNATVNLPVGGSVAFLATCAISPAATGTLTNTANVAPGAGVTDPNGTNNSATDTDTLIPTADITVAKTVAPTAVDNGDPVTYTIVVGNLGPSDATGVTVTDLFPVQCQANLAWTCTPAGGATCTPAGVGNIVDVVSLPVGSNVTYVATCSAYSPEDTEVENTATAQVPAGVTDPNPANSSSTATLAINAFAIQEIPTLGRAGLVALLVLLGFAGYLLLRRTH